MRRRISIWGRVRPSVGPSVRRSVRPYVPCYFRRWKARILGASCAVYPALFLPSALPKFTFYYLKMDDWKKVILTLYIIVVCFLFKHVCDLQKYILRFRNEPITPKMMRLFGEPVHVCTRSCTIPNVFSGRFGDFYGYVMEGQIFTL